MSGWSRIWQPFSLFFICNLYKKEIIYKMNIMIDIRRWHTNPFLILLKMDKYDSDFI